MLDDIFTRSRNSFKAICLAVAFLFCINTICWAYPDTIQTMSDTLSGQSVFQPVMFSPEAENFKNSIFSEADTLTTTLTAAQYLLGDPDKDLGRMPLEHLEGVVGSALEKADLKSENIDLSHVYYHPETSKIVLLPYTTSGKRHVIQVARKDDTPEKMLTGYDWLISDKYVVKVLPEKKIPSIRKKVLLIASPLISFDIGQKEKRSGYFTKPPLGFYKIKKDLTAKELAYVDVFDPNLHPENAPELLADMIKNEGYDIVSIGLMHENTKDVIGWIDNIKGIAEESGQKAPIVIGGAQEGTHNYKKWFRFSQIDAIVLGYGELPLSHIIYNLNHGKEPFAMVPGVAYENTGGEVVVQPAEDFDNEDFREFTFINDPAEYIPYEDYWKHNGNLYSPANYKARGATLEAVEFSTSSHCRNRCGFCSRCTVLEAATGIQNRPVLSLSAEEMLELLLKYINYHAPKAVFMREDDLINDRTKGRSRAIEFFKLVKQARYEGMIPFDFKIYLQTKTKTLIQVDEDGVYRPDMELLRSMADAGVYLTAMGVESFSDRLLKAPSINKKATSEMHWAAIDGLRKVGIIPLVNVQLFPPEITASDFIKNAEGVLKHIRLGGQVSVLPTLDYLPGSAIARKADSGEYETIGYHLVDKRTGEEIYHPVTFVPKDALMKRAFLEREKRQAEIEAELMGNPRYAGFTYPPQPVIGLIRIAAVYRSLNMEDKVQEIYQAIYKLIAKAERFDQDWEYPHLIRTYETIKHQETKARLLMRSKEITLSKASDLCVIMDNVISGDNNLRGRISFYLMNFLEFAPNSPENIPIKDRIRISLKRNNLLYEDESEERGYGISGELGVIDTGDETFAGESKLIVKGRLGIKRIVTFLSLMLISFSSQLQAAEKSIESLWRGTEALGGLASVSITSFAGYISLGSLQSIFPMHGVLAIFVVMLYKAIKRAFEKAVVFSALDEYRAQYNEALHSPTTHLIIETIINEIHARKDIPDQFKYPLMKEMAFTALSVAEIDIIDKIESRIHYSHDSAGYMSMALADAVGSSESIMGITNLIYSQELSTDQKLEALSYLNAIGGQKTAFVLMDFVVDGHLNYKVREEAYKYLILRGDKTLIKEASRLRPTLRERIKDSFREMFTEHYMKERLFAVLWVALVSEAVVWGSPNLALSTLAAGVISIIVVPVLIGISAAIAGVYSHMRRINDNERYSQPKKISKKGKRGASTIGAVLTAGVLALLLMVAGTAFSSEAQLASESTKGISSGGSILTALRSILVFWCSFIISAVFFNAKEGKNKEDAFLKRIGIVILAYVLLFSDITIPAWVLFPVILGVGVSMISYMTIQMRALEPSINLTEDDVIPVSFEEKADLFKQYISQDDVLSYTNIYNSFVEPILSLGPGEILSSNILLLAKLVQESQRKIFDKALIRTIPRLREILADEANRYTMDNQKQAYLALRVLAELKGNKRAGEILQKHPLVILPEDINQHFSDEDRPSREGSIDYPKDETLCLFEIFAKEANSRRRSCIEAANRLNSKYYRLRENGMRPPVILDKMPTAEARRRIDLVLMSYYSDEDLLDALSDKEMESLEKLKEEVDLIEVDAVISGIISSAMNAALSDKDFVLAIETDWIEGYLQWEAIDTLVKEIGKLERTLSKAGLNNLKVILKGDEEDTDSWAMRIKDASGSDSDLSNVLIFGSIKSINYFDDIIMKTTSLEERAFLAGVDSSKLDRSYRKNTEDFSRQLEIPLVEMLSASLEIALGKADPKLLLVSGISVTFDSVNKVLHLIPSAHPVEYDHLKEEYSLKLKALRAA